jgi:hypothetical protein
MGFKMNGSPAKMGTIQGTAGYSSALKMKVEENASALKQKAYGGAGKTWGEYNKASGGALNADTKTQKEYEAKMRKENPNWDKKKDNTWKMQQNKINKHVGSKVVHSVDEIKNNIKTTATSGGDQTTTTTATATGATTKRDDKKLEVLAKFIKKAGEAIENKDKGDAKADYKYAKKTFGKGSEEERTAKLNKLIAKEADRQGESGGKKQGIFRKLSSAINKARQKNVTKDIADIQMKKQPTSTGEPMDANNSAAKYHSPAKQNIFAEGNNPKKTIEEEASDYRKNTKNRNKTKVDPYTQKYIDYVNTKVGVEGGPKRDKYGNLIK